jgi:ABC-type polysaccharide/polyol phosphate export permease
MQTEVAARARHALAPAAQPQPAAERVAHRAHRHHRTDRLRTYVGLVGALSRKNFQIRFKRASLGVLWAILQPAFQAAFLSFVFLKVFRITRVPHYPLYVLSGILPWAFFSQSAIAATTSIVDNAALVRKVSVPRSIFPLSAIGGTAMAFAAALLVLVAATAVSGLLGLGVLLLLPAVVLEILFLTGVSLITSSFNVAFRDVKYLVESSLLVGLYATPILYDLDPVSSGFRNAIRLNPMTGVLSLTRAAILGRSVDGRAVVCSLLVSSVLVAAGALLFHRRSDEFADLL